MAPMEDDPALWEILMRSVRSMFSVFTFSALAGAVVGIFRKNRRMSWRRVVQLVCMSVAVGCGLTPLFMHVFSLPDTTAQSVAFFLGVVGLDGLDMVSAFFGGRKSPEGPGEEDQ